MIKPKNKTGYFSFLCLFLIVLFIMTFPLMLKMGSSIPGSRNTDESFAVLQQFWWQKYSHIKHTPSTDEYLTASPFGIKHEAVFIHPLWHHISRFLSIATNEIMAYNLIVITNLILSFLTMFLLTNYLFKNMMVSFFSSIIYVLCPYQFSRLWQHFSLTFTEWMPLYILSLVKIHERISLKNVLFCVCSFFLVALFDSYYTFFMLIITVPLFIYLFFQKTEYSKLELLRTYSIIYSLITIIALIIMMPFLKILILSKGQAPSAWSIIRPFDDLFTQSARPLSYFLPAPDHPIFGRFSEQFIGSQMYGTSFTEHVLYLGWVPLILAFVAFKKWLKSRKTEPKKESSVLGFFIFLALTAWFLSQPPWWDLFGLKLYMPSFFMYKIVPTLRAYCRFGIVVMLGVAVLAGFGLKYLLENFKSNRTKTVITAIACGLVIFEFWNWPPFKVIDVSRVPEAYYWLKAQPGDIAIAEYPLDTGGANERYKFYQTTHQKKIINGTTPGTYANRLAQTITKLSLPETPQILKWLGVKYVLVHRDKYLQTELTEDKEELGKIPQNKNLRYIKTFPEQTCPGETMCTQKTGPIDVYEVDAVAVKPEIKE